MHNKRMRQSCMHLEGSVILCMDKIDEFSSLPLLCSVVGVVLGVVGEFGWTSLDGPILLVFFFFRQLVGEASLWFHSGSKYLVNVLVELLSCGFPSSVHESFL